MALPKGFSQLHDFSVSDRRATLVDLSMVPPRPNSTLVVLIREKDVNPHLADAMGLVGCFSAVP